MFFYAARQPILNRDKELFGYELLFRDGVENSFPNIDGDEATSRMIEGSQFSFGLDDFIGGKLGFINFTLDTLLKKYPSMLPKEQVVIEILETIQPGKQLLEECRQLKEEGYILALDDYQHRNVWRHFYPYIDLIKIDVRTTDATEIATIINAISDYPHIKLIAEKVETNQEFEQALAQGFSYFQGYFFSKPEMMQTRALSPAQYALAELLYETSKPEMDLAKVTEIFKRDVTLSYKLLRYSNSPMFRRQAEIETIKHALVVLGETELKKLLSLLFTAQISTDKPAELMRLAMTRASFAEQLAILHQPALREKAFLTGMMSLMDAILDEPISNVMEKLPLTIDIKDALVNQSGLLANYVQLSRFYETADWPSATALISELKMPTASIPDAYHNAVQWANEHMKNLSAVN